MQSQPQLSKPQNYKQLENKKQQQPQQSTEDFTNITVVLTRKRNWYSNTYSGS